jgi:hypothetical protein
MPTENPTHTHTGRPTPTHTVTHALNRIPPDGQEYEADSLV